MGCGSSGYIYDPDGSPGWEDELRRFTEEVQVPTVHDADMPMNPVEDAVYRSMKTWRTEGTTPWYNPAFGD